MTVLRQRPPNLLCRLAPLGLVLLSLSALPGGARAQAAASSGADYATDGVWRSPGDSGEMPALQGFPNAAGTLGTLNARGPVATAGHAFFTPLGSNGRACISCHQPSDGMSLSLNTIRERWTATQGKDPLFAPIDGANCPNLPRGQQASHSLLLQRGLFRIPLAWPPRDAQGKPIRPDFSIEVVRDPTSCNLDPVYGLKSKQPTVSVYRRPRPAANLKYILAVGFSFDPKSGLPLQRDPDSGAYVSEALMADSRALTLKAQAQDAIRGHLQAQGNPTVEQLRQIVEFESQIYSAQSHDRWGGSLADGGAQGGPAALQAAPAGVLQSTRAPIWKEFFPWKDGGGAATPEQREFRASVARGAELFSKRMFLINGSAGINSMGFGDPVRNSCAMCHNMASSGIDVAPGRVDIGTTNEPHAKPSPELPLFKLSCRPDAKPHPFLGRVVYTQDPGYALTTGRCEDIGKVVTQQMRGLAARAPYFGNGSAATLRELVEIYNRRYRIELSEREIQDLVNLMSVL
jgi:hypothetical protein